MRLGGSLIVRRQVAPAHAMLGGQIVRSYWAAAAVGIQLRLHATLLNLLQGGLRVEEQGAGGGDG